MAAPQLTPAHFQGLSDRRKSNRFPMQEEVRYRVLGGKSRNLRGCGKTANMSSTGLFMTTESELQRGRLVELSVNWPARLAGVCPLQFVAIGRVVRADGACAAVRIEKYDFKTRRAVA